MAMNPIDIIGMGADGAAGLRPDALERIRSADFLAGGERHLQYFAAGKDCFTIRNNVAELAAELGKRRGQHCVVLASGDPLFFGIGSILVEKLGPDSVRLEPALSSMQLAFARAGMSWQNAVLASVHGRPARATLLPMLGRRKIGLFTADGTGPAQVADFFLGFGMEEYEAVVGEMLGSVSEKISRWPSLVGLQGQQFAPLNYLVLRRTAHPARLAVEAAQRSLVPGAPDRAFARSAGAVATRQEVRAVVLAQLGGLLRRGDTFWDIGAGTGTVGIEVAVLRPGIEVIAVERDPQRGEILRENRLRFGAFNVRLIEGTAPEALEGEKRRPRVIFIGGSGKQLPAILDLAGLRLAPGGRLLATFVTLENLATTLHWLRAHNWPTRVTHLQVARSDALAGLTGLRPQRGVYLVSARPASPA